MISPAQIAHLIRTEKSETTLLKVMVSEDGEAWSVVGSYNCGTQFSGARLAAKLADARFVKVERHLVDELASRRIQPT